MGNYVSEIWPDKLSPAPVKYYWYGAPCAISPRDKPTFDPMLGFPNGRKEREMEMGLDEMIDARVPPEHRTYCAPNYMVFQKCMRDTSAPRRVFQGACRPAWHDYEQCRANLEVFQFKEYERERRLRARQQRRIAKGLEPDPNEDLISM